jgi:hypothetical protein
LQRFRPHRSKLVSSTLGYSPLQPEPRILCESFVNVAFRICGVAMTTWELGIAAMCKSGTVTPISPVNVPYRISGVATTTRSFAIALTCEFRIAVCKARTVMPRTRAITRMKPRETARAAATVPPIEGPAEDKFFTFSGREVKYQKSQPPDDWHCVDRRVCIPVSRTRAGPADREGVRRALEV